MIKRGPPVRYPRRYPNRFPSRTPLINRPSINHFPDKIPDKKTSSTSTLSKSTKFLVILSGLFILAIVIFLIVRSFSGDNDKDYEINKFTSDLKISNARLLNYSDINVNITPPDEDDNVEFIVFVFYTNGSEMTRRKIPIENLSNANFEIIFHFANASKIDKISVIPVFKDESGKEVQGKVEDQYVVSTVNMNNTNITNQTHPEDYLENGTFICKSNSQCEDYNNCTRNVCSNGNCTYIKNSNCVPCEFQYECEDLNPCTSNKCMNGVCTYLSIPNCVTCYSPTQCEDNNLCTEDICFNERCMHNKINNCTTSNVNNQSNVTNNTSNNTQPILECLTSSDCEDYDSCTRNLCSLNKCVYTNITSCISGDGCCPEGRGCIFTNDNDCLSVCGNNIKEGTEQCDGTYLGGATCAGVMNNPGYTGILKCDDCRFNSSLCVPPCSQTCESLGYKCGSRIICGERVYCGDCPDGYSCNVNGTCMNRCISESSASLCNRLGKDCGSATGTDNCGITRTVDCGGCLDGYDCNSQGECIQTTPPCSDECNQLNLRVCYSSSTYRICGANYDSDSCLEWSSPITCSTGICSNGQCVSTVPQCTDECSPLDRKECYGSGYRTCGNYDTSDSCLEWSGAIVCNTGQTCVNGACVTSGGGGGTVEQADYYVSTSGSDSNPGTIDRPFATWQKGFDMAQAGDLVYIRGGIYRPSGRLVSGGYYAVYVSGKSGTSSSPIRIEAYPGETPILDGSNMNQNAVHVGLYLGSCSYYHLKGLIVQNVKEYGQYPGCPLARPFGLYASNHIKIEQCTVRNSGDGFSASGKCDYIEYINCDAYDNADYSDGGGFANGFTLTMYVSPGPTGATGTHVTLTGCRAWGNSDDGFDLFAANGYFTFDDCWAWDNGWGPGGDGNGDGFKSEQSLAAEPGVQRIYRNCIAWNNRGQGFCAHVIGDSTHGIHQLYNCISYNNNQHGFGYGISEGGVPPCVFRNNIAFANDMQQYGGLSGYINDHNSWNGGVTVDSNDFITLDSSAASNPRKSDGSLPDITFLHLRSDSDLIDKGINVGLPYSGSAPDIGAFERQ